MLHSKRVSEFCEDIAAKMNFNKENVSQIRIAGLMHDIGKIGIDENILNKPQKLSSDEWKEIERHSEIGYRILSSVNEFSEIAEHVLEHHEKWNGKGYPRGLKGEEISLQARIIAVADAFDAMTRDRAYGKALSEEEAINEIRRCSGTQFDPEIAGVFVEKVLGKEWK
jgi:putative nucleotidyltransferase with HDIG domain